MHSVYISLETIHFQLVLTQEKGFHILPKVHGLGKMALCLIQPIIKFNKMTFHVH